MIDLINVHAWILLPAREHPVDESLECDLLFVAIVSPPVAKFDQVSGVVSRTRAEQIFQSSGNQGISFHIKENIRRIGWRERSQTHGLAIRALMRQNFVTRFSLRIRLTLVARLTLKSPLRNKLLQCPVVQL